MLVRRCSLSSVWWKDLCLIGKGFDVEGDWLVDGVCKKLGNAKSVQFWKERWLGRSPLEDVFPRTYTISSLQLGLISAFRRWEGHA